MNTKTILKRLFQYLKHEKRKFLMITIFVFLSTIISVITPLLIEYAVDNFIKRNILTKLPNLLFLLVFLFIMSSLFTKIMNGMMGTISENTLYLLRKDLFQKIQKLHIGFFDSEKRGDLMSRFTNDITNVGDVLADTIVNVISSMILLVLVTIMMFYINGFLAFMTILIVPFSFFILIKIGKKANLYYDKNQKELGELSSIIEEYTTNMKTIKQYEKEEFCSKKFDQINQSFRNISIQSETISGMILPMNTAIANIGNLLIIFIGATLIIDSKLTIGGMMAFLSYAAMFRTPINNLASLLSELASAIASSKRVFEIMDIEEQGKDNKNILSTSKLKGDIEFQNVTFGYTDKIIIKNINLHVKKGEKIALVGPTGAGKTTIVNLLTRFYDIEEGSILIDQKNIKDYFKKDLRNQIGIILQDNYLFKGTVEENIKYSNQKATRREVINASKKAMAHPFIHRLSNGYDTMIEEGGTNLSSGEKQLISIARTILKNPDILILDEATSNIDVNTELYIQKGLDQLMKNKTTFIIAHRLSTIKKVDQILYLQNGMIKEKGTHLELLAKKGNYYKLYNSQFQGKM